MSGLHKVLNNIFNNKMFGSIMNKPWILNMLGF